MLIHQIDPPLSSEDIAKFMKDFVFVIQFTTEKFSLFLAIKHPRFLFEAVLRLKLFQNIEEKGKEKLKTESLGSLKLALF